MAAPRTTNRGYGETARTHSIALTEKVDATIATLCSEVAVLKVEMTAQKELAVERITTARTLAEQALTKVENAADKAYLEARIEALKDQLLSHIQYKKEAVDLALAGQIKSEEKASAALKERLEGMNEFRKSLEDLSERFTLKRESDLRFEAAEKEIQFLRDELTTMRGRGQGLHAGWVYVLGAIAALGTGVSLFLAMRLP